MIGGYDDKYKGASTFTIDAKLGNDLIGRALADIGDPSIPVVKEMLSNGTFPERRRAFWILVNIDSPAEQEAMRNHLPSESNPGLREMIQKRLRLPE
jgi:hypothetical protein